MSFRIPIQPIDTQALRCQDVLLYLQAWSRQPAVLAVQERVSMHRWLFVVVGAALLTQACIVTRRGTFASSNSTKDLSPTAIVASPSGHELFVAMATGHRLAALSPSDLRILRESPLPASPTGLCISEDGRRLIVTLDGAPGQALIIETKGLKVLCSAQLGNSPCGPALIEDEDVLFVCNRFDNDVSVVDLKAGKTLARIPVLREPVAACLSPDQRLLLVANHLPTGRSDGDVVAAQVTVIDVAKREVLRNISLPNGSSGLRGIACSPDGKTAFVTHALSRFHVPTTQLERGWMNTAGLSLIDMEALKLRNCVLLDDVDNGAANPWAVACSKNGDKVFVTLAGRHELSVIDTPALLEKLRTLEAGPDPTQPVDPYAVSLTPADVPNDLSFLARIRERIPLKGNGPRSLVCLGNRILIPEYFTDSLSVVDLDASPYRRVQSVALGPTREPSTVRRGEILFNDGAICFQGWQSCATCHPDARTDGLNWDLLNDGMGNPKNTKSMLLAHKTPPAMSLGIRDTAETAVRSGIKFIQFVVRPEEDAVAIDEYLKSLRPARSPALVDDRLSEPAERGKKIFFSDSVGCARCHSGPYYTDLKSYDVGTRGELDGPEPLDTPGLIEIWRTSPYLHDGRSATIRDLLTRDNIEDKHGRTSQLTEQEIEDLVAFLMCL